MSLPKLYAALLDRRRRLEGRLLALEKPVRIYAGTFRAPDPTHILKRGDPMQKLEEVRPSALSQIGPSFVLKSGATEAERRRALADWIAHPDNPLPARVMVNRVWQGHFGQGLLRTPSDFGFNGDRPSHPELLDWLAKEYQLNGWRLKPLHRLIVLSSTYRQASRFDAKAATLDASNRLLWRYPPRRLEAEAIRDTMLQVSGALNQRMGGPGYHLWEYSGYVIVFKPKTLLGPEEFRRMIYQFKPRLQQDGTFGVFDCPDATTTMPRRNRSTTALQSAQSAQRSLRPRSRRTLRRPAAPRRRRGACGAGPSGVPAGVWTRADGGRSERGEQTGAGARIGGVVPDAVQRQRVCLRELGMNPQRHRGKRNSAVLESNRRTIPWLSRHKPKRLPFVRMPPALCALAIRASCWSW